METEKRGIETEKSTFGIASQRFKSCLKSQTTLLHCLTHVLSLRGNLHKVLSINGITSKPWQSHPKKYSPKNNAFDGASNYWIATLAFRFCKPLNINTLVRNDSLEG